MKKTIAIDGERLNADIRTRLPLALRSQSGLVHMAEGALSLSVVNRAVGGRATKRSLDIICNFLGSEPGRYVDQGLEPQWRGLNLSGNWIALYWEQEPSFDPYVVKERLVITQEGKELNGFYEPFESQHPRGHFEYSWFNMNGRVCDDFVYGTYHRDIEHRFYPRGTGVFHLKMIREGNWAEGFCTFISDERVVGLSANIWVRENSEEFAIKVEQAERGMKDDRCFMTSPRSVPK